MSDTTTSALRDAFGRFITGVTVITTRGKDGTPVGFTANSFTSVSMDPPLLLVCPGKFLSSYNAFANCQTFSVSILAEGQEDVSNTFAGYKGDRFARVEHQLDLHNIPVIAGATATFSCQTHQIIEAGDHAILIGEVKAFETRERPALGYKRGQYFSLGLERAAAANTAQKTICGVILRSGDSVLLERTSSGYRPPQRILTDRRDIPSSLARDLAARGIDARLGPVYSVYDDPASGTHFAYLLAHCARETEDTDGLERVPLEQLTTIQFATDALTQMMQRFSQEMKTRDFSFYMGDVDQGRTYTLNDRG